MKKIIVLFAVVMAATLILTSLAFSKYPTKKYEERDSLLYVDGKPVYNLRDLSDEDYDSKVGTFTLDEKTYFVRIYNDASLSIGGFDTVTFNTTKFTADEENITNWHFWATEDLKSFVKSDDSWTRTCSALSPNYENNGFIIIVFYEYPEVLYPDYAEYDSVMESVVAESSDINFALTDPTAPEGPGDE